MAALKNLPAGFSSPAVLRAAPFIIFVLLTAAQGKCGPVSAYWFYFAKTILGIGMIFAVRPLVMEMRWAFSWEAVVVGVGIFLAWIGISGDWTVQNTLWVKLGLASASKNSRFTWNPFAEFGNASLLAWFFVAVRILGSTFVVPPIEEMFYRSFFYRYLARPDFLSVPLNRFIPFPFIITACIFGFSHNEWLAGILCGMAYQWLVLRKNRLGDAMTAHAITNFLLGVWVVWKNAWNFW